MDVWVAYDAMNEEVVGVFSTEQRAESFRQAYPAPSQLHVEPFVIDMGRDVRPRGMRRI